MWAVSQEALTEAADVSFLLCRAPVLCGGSGGQQGRLEGAGAGAVARGQHLTREMVQSVVSFYEEGDETINSVRGRGCKKNTYIITKKSGFWRNEFAQSEHYKQ